MYIHVHYIGLVNSRIEQKIHMIVFEQDYDIPYYIYSIVQRYISIGVKYYFQVEMVNMMMHRPNISNNVHTLFKHAHERIVRIVISPDVLYYPF